MFKKGNTSEKFVFVLSIISNVITICTPIVTYFTINEFFIGVTVVFLALTIVRNIFLSYKLRKATGRLSLLHNTKEENDILQKDKKMLEDQLECAQNENDILQKDNKKLEEQLERIRRDLLDGKAPSDILVNYYIMEVDNQLVTFTEMKIDVNVLYVEKAKLFDVKYTWNVTGINPSNDIPLSQLNFLISGDSIITNNAELGLKIEILRSGRWQEVKGYLSGSTKIKYLHIEFEHYSILPNHHFEIRFSYTWPRSYNADGGDMFSFGSNSFSSTKPYDINIKIHANKACFNSARSQIRSKLNESDYKDQFYELDIVENQSENIVVVPLPASQEGKTIYISLT